MKLDIEDLANAYIEIKSKEWGWEPVLRIDFREQLFVIEVDGSDDGDGSIMIEEEVKFEDVTDISVS